MINSFTFRAFSRKAISLSIYSGIVVRGVFFRMLALSDPQLATTIHERGTLSPYSVSPLEDASQRWVLFDYIPCDVCFRFRLVALNDKISTAIQRAILSGDAPTIKLRGLELPVSEVLINSVEHDFSEKASGNATRFVVDFRSPTFFRDTQKGLGLLAMMIPRRFRRPVKPVYRYVIVPDPYHFFRGLARLYRQFCNPNFRYRSYCEWLLEGGVALETFYNLRVVKVWDSAGRWARGFMGRAVFAIPKDLYDQKMAKLTHTLLEFAQYSNVGGNRTAGFGVVEYRIMGDETCGRRDPAANTV